MSCLELYIFVDLCERGEAQKDTPIAFSVAFSVARETCRGRLLLFHGQVDWPRAEDVENFEPMRKNLRLHRSN